MQWNTGKTATVMMNKIKEITINSEMVNEQTKHHVKGWYNQYNFFYFGEFTTLLMAQGYVQKLKTHYRLVWNKNKTAAVTMSKIKECTISKDNEKAYSIRGWYNKENSFLFGTDFKSPEECHKFLNDINDRL